MNNSFLPLGRRGIGVAVVVAAVAGAVGIGLSNLNADDPKPKATSSRPERSATPAAIITVTPGPAVAKKRPPPSPIAVPAGWSRYSSKELGVSFMFPRPGGNVRYSFHSPSDSEDPGFAFEWDAERTETYDPQMSRGYAYTFAGTQTPDFAPGRSFWITDILRWHWKGSQTIVVFDETRPGFRIAVKPLRTVKTDEGYDGLIFDPRSNETTRFSSNGDRAGIRAAVLNFPAGYDPAIRGMTFYFYDKISLDDIERVLESVELSNDGPTYR